MKPENKAFLDANRGIYDMLMLSGEIIHLDGHTKFKMIDVIREEFNGGYLINPSCGECVIAMVKLAYEQYDKYLKEQERIVAMTFPVNDPPNDEPNNIPDEPTNEAPKAPKSNHKRKSKR
jgi:hypothetical protein